MAKRPKQPKPVPPDNKQDAIPPAPPPFPPGELLRGFMSLYRGFEEAHGLHRLFAEADDTGKLKGDAKTLRGAATEAEYREHLDGERRQSLGIIPLLKDLTCWFGAIDIDTKGEFKLREDIATLEKRVRQLELPLVVCRSKSGGAHLYLFARKDPIDAELLTTKLKEFAATLGYAGSEIFPKQTTRVNDEDRGNWINISYAGALGKETTSRYCIRNGKPLFTLAEFLPYAESMRISARELRDTKLKLDERWEDGPPCIQHLVTIGIGDGGRNITLTNVAIYMKKKFPDDWQDRTLQFNEKEVHPPLDEPEVLQILRNVGKKEYVFTCKQSPIANHCDRKLCLKRQYGISDGNSGGDLFPIDSLTKCIAKDSVRWYIECEGQRAEVTTEQLLSSPLLQRVYLERYNKLILFGKSRDHLESMREKIEACDIVMDPEDASPQGQFEKLLDNFFEASRPARNRDEIIKGNSFIDSGRIFFRSEDLFNYLAIRRFNQSPHVVWSWLKDLGAIAQQVKVRGKMLRVWTLPEPERFDQTTPLDVPEESQQEEL